MQDQKLENLLNLALSATPEEREKSGNLNVGYNPVEKNMGCHCETFRRYRFSYRDRNQGGANVK